MFLNVSLARIKCYNNNPIMQMKLEMVISKAVRYWVFYDFMSNVWARSSLRHLGLTLIKHSTPHHLCKAHSQAAWNDGKWQQATWLTLLWSVIVFSTKPAQYVICVKWIQKEYKYKYNTNIQNISKPYIVHLFVWQYFYTTHL